MKHWSDIKGQADAVKFLRGSLESGAVAQSYLFWGPEGVGRSLAARAYILELFSKGAEKDLSVLRKQVYDKKHPDLIWVKPEKMKAIKIETVRGIIDALNLKPYQSPVSAAVIEDAHLMTEEAANALLKLLEEPPRSSVIILMTDKKELLLQTVLSRTTKVRFGNLSDELTCQIIRPIMEDVPETEVRLLARFSEGCPGRALRYLDEGLLERRKYLLDKFSEALREGIAHFAWLEESDRTVLSEDIELLIMSLRDAAFKSEGIDVSRREEGPERGLADIFSCLKPSEFDKTLRALVKAKEALSANCNAKLLGQILPGMILGDRSV